MDQQAYREGLSRLKKSMITQKQNGGALVGGQGDSRGGLT